MGRSDTGMTTGWREGKPWEIALGELRGEGAIRKRQEGGRGGTVGNIAWGELRWEGAMRKRSSGGKERYTEVMTGWTEGKPWEIASGELPWEGAIYGSDDSVDGGGTVGNSLGRAPWGRSVGKERYGNDDRVHGGETGEIAWGELRWEGAIRE